LDNSVQSSAIAEPAASPTEQLVNDLQQLRTDHGCLSYADIVLRVTNARLSRGMTPDAARIARSSVYDCFRTGRTRINPALVGEIVSAITGDEAQAALWVMRCQEARAGTEHKAISVSYRQALIFQLPAPKPHPLWFSFVVVLACCGGNVALSFAIRYLFHDWFPLYMDMVSTAVVALCLGPGWGVVAVAVSKLIQLLYESPDRLPFALVAIAGALVWGYGVQKWKMAKNLPRFVLLNLLVGLVCSMVAVPVLLIFFGGAAMMPNSQNMIEAMMAVGNHFLVSVFSTNLLISLADKLVAGLIGLLVAGTLLKRYAPKDLVALTMTPSQLLQRSTLAEPIPQQP